MTTFQKLTLLIGALILVALVAIVAVLLLRPAGTVVLTTTPPAAQALTTEEIIAIGATARNATFGVTDMELTATWVVGQNYIIETQLAVSATRRAERMTATAAAGG